MCLPLLGCSARVLVVRGYQKEALLVRGISEERSKKGGRSRREERTLVIYKQVTRGGVDRHGRTAASNP